MIIPTGRRCCGRWVLGLLLTLSAALVRAEPPPGYHLAWADEFDGDSLDQSKWGYRTDSRHWSTQVPENVSVAGGLLRLALRKEKRDGMEYTGAGVISRPVFRYGYYEARFRIPPGAGWHTSFWLMRHNGRGGTGPEAARQEIDIGEQDSVDPRHYTVNLHDWAGRQRSFGPVKVATDDLAADFHVWGCEFTPQKVRCFFEGRLVHEFDATVLEHGDHNIWLTSIASHLGATKAVDDTKLPAEAVFDYVRFYEKAEARD